MAFVGSGRRAFVDALVAMLDGRERDGAAWVHLTAPSGWGKTRIAQEVYARLAERQPTPPYWPARIVDPEAVVDLSARRKHVAPSVTHIPDSLPSFMWWGVACSSRNGSPALAIAEDLGQFRAHLGYLMLATRSAAERRSFLRAVLGDLTATMTELVVTSPVPTPAGLETEVGVAASVARSIIQSAASFWSGRRRARDDAAALLANDAEIREEQDSLIDTAVDAVVSVARGGLPVVVFVEDAHLADPVLCEVLARVVVLDRPILIVTTAVPGHADHNEDLQQAIARARDAARFVDAKWDEPLPPPFPAAANLAPLAVADRYEILESEFTTVPEEVGLLLCERYENPLALELFCQLPRYRRADGSLDITAADIERLPRGVRGLYEQLWEQLPQAVRTALALAAVGIPERIDHAFGRNHEWDWALTADAAANLGLPEAADVADALRDAANAYAWARIVSEHLRRFHDPDQMTVAAEDDSFFDQDDALRAIAEVLTSGTELELTDDEILHRSRLALALHATGYITDSAVLAEAALNITSALAGEPLALEQVIETGEYALEHAADDPTEELLEVARLTASAMIDRGQLADGINLLRELVEAYEQVYGADDITTLYARNSLGDALNGAGAYGEAIEVFRDLIADLERVLGPDDALTLISRNNLALALESSGAIDEAIDAFRALLPDRIRVFGPEDPGVLRTRNNLALALSNRGDHDEAIEQLEALVADRTRVEGSDAPGTLTTRNNLALALGEAGQISEAISQFRIVAEARERVLGPTHPRTLGTRANLASMLARSGAIDEAIERYRELAIDQADALDRLHPSAIMTRNNLAYWLAQRGDLDEAIVLSTATVADFEKVVGPDNPKTQRSRANFAELLTDAGRFDEAIECTREQIASLERTLGPDDDRVRWDRWRLAILLGETGAHGDALSVYETLLADTLRIHGPDHEDVALLRAAIADLR